MFLTRITRLFLLSTLAVFLYQHTALAQAAISYGQTLSGSISAAAEKDEFTFNGTSGEKITLRFAKTSGAIVLYAELLNPSGTRIAYSNAGEINATLAVSGTFKITLRDYSNINTGNYSLTIQRTNNSIGDIPLTFGQTVSGSIDAFSKIITYSFSANANDTVTIRSAKTATISGTFGVYLELYNSNGTRIAYTAANSLTNKVTTAGTYYLLVTDQIRDGTGTYSLGIQRVNNPLSATALNYGQTVAGSIDSFAKIITYSFSANSNDTITVRSATVTTASGTFSPYLELYDPSGTLVAYSVTNSLISKATLTGNYCLLVTDSYRDGSGTYSLSIQRVNNPVGATALIFGQTTIGNIDSFSKIIPYTFAANANDKILIPYIKINQASGTFDPYLELYDSSGALVTTRANGRLEFIAPANGNFCLYVTDNYRNGTGTFELSIQRANNPANTIDLSYDTITEDAINTVTQFKVYKSTAQANDKITFCSTSKIGTDKFNVNAEIFDSSGVRLAVSFSGGLKYTFTVGGTFYLFISDNLYDGTGTYRFSLVKSDVLCTSIDLVDPQVTLNTPKSGEVVENNSNYNIRWLSNDNFGFGVTWQEIRLSVDSGNSYPTVITTALAGSVQSYSWSVPLSLSSAKARIKVIARDVKGNEGYNTNKEDFIIISTALPIDAANLSYQYDNQNRLIQSGNGVSNTTYTYDQADNRLNLNTN